MFDAPVDAWYVWVGVAMVSVAALGVGVRLPATAPPDATAVARTVDEVAASPYAATGEHPVTADAVMIGPHALVLRRDGARARATFSHGPVTPVREGTALASVLSGTPPDEAFASPEEFEDAIVAARARDPGWRDPAGGIVVRRVSWEGVDATLVGT